MKQRIEVEKIHTYAGHKDCVYTLEKFNSKEFFSAGGDGMVVHWNLDKLESGTMIAKVPNSIYALHYMPAEDILVVGHNYDGIHLIGVKDKKEKGSLKLTEAAIFDIKSDSQNIYVGTGDGDVIVVDKNKLTIKTKIEHSSKSARTIYSMKGKLLIGYSDNHIRVIDKMNWTLTQDIDAHKISVFSLTSDPDQKYVLSASRDAHLKIWSADSMDLKKDIVAHMFAINHVTYSPDGQHFVTCSMDKSIKVWDSDTFALIKVIDKARHAGHGTSVNKLLWLEHNNYLVSCSDDRSISVWNIKFGDL